MPELLIFKEKETQFIVKFFIDGFPYGISGISCLQNNAACVSEWQSGGFYSLTAENIRLSSFSATIFCLSFATWE